MTGIAQILNKTSPLQPNKQVVSVYLADSSELTQVLGSVSWMGCMVLGSYWAMAAVVQMLLSSYQ